MVWNRTVGSPTSPHVEEDNRIARLAIRYILCNPAISAPIPGLITVEQVDNMALAIKERRELDKEERAELDRAMDRAWANLLSTYQWLKDLGIRVVCRRLLDSLKEACRRRRREGVITPRLAVGYGSACAGQASVDERRCSPRLR
jgi:hypothetical protein